MASIRRRRRLTLTLVSVILWLIVAGVDGGLARWRMWNYARSVENFSYHHGYLPNESYRYSWGPYRNRFVTNSLAMKDASIRQVPKTSSRRRVVFIGDSFVDGIGMSYDESFIGQLQPWLAPGIETLNAGVPSFSPKLEYLRVKQLLETEQLSFNELYVFLDISDVEDELTYEDFVPNPSPSAGLRLKHWLAQHSFGFEMTREEVTRVRTRWRMRHEPSPIAPVAPLRAVGRPIDAGSALRSSWTFTPALMAPEGQHGLDLATAHMEKLYQLCRRYGIKVSLAVYPWPHQIIAGDRNSLQVTHWKAFADARGLPFLNYFEVFFAGTPEKTDEILDKYFIPGDVHLVEAGYRLVAEGLCNPRVNPSARDLCASSHGTK